MAEQTPDNIITTQRNGQTIVAELFFNHSSTETFRDKLLKLVLADSSRLSASDGQDMDYGIFKELDYLIIGAHRNEIMSKKEATRRLIKAIENPNSNILAHPQSRIYQKKVGLYVDIQMIIDACKENSVVIEINGDPDRLDLSPEHIE